MAARKEEKHVSVISEWFSKRNWTQFPFQKEVQSAYLEGKSGLLNAPTGSGKTYALWLPVLAEYIRENPDYKKPRKNGLRILWITPLRALANDIRNAMQEACTELGIPWQVASRTGDTSSAEKQRQKRNMPECLVTTPESLHILLAQKGYEDLFKNMRAIIIDEWHEVLGTKRGVQIELALSRIRNLSKESTLKTWGISATIGNMNEALDVLVGPVYKGDKIIIRAELAKKIEIVSVLPDEIEKFPWAGHLGIKLLPQIIKIIDDSRSTLLFTNTRSQTEIWYQYLLLQAPHLAGVIAMHHGSLDNDIRNWVETSLHEGKLKVVVCTSSLDLGVDFRPVETVIQVGGPKGVSRFLQRAGRSGHQPGATSRIYFVPTNSLELIEGAAIKEAIKEKKFESRKPIDLSFDVLLQYLVTLATSEGFVSEALYDEVRTTHAFRDMTQLQWEWALDFITKGGKSLGSYDEFNKVEKEGDRYVVKNKKIATMHRLSIGTIVGDPVLNVQYMSGKRVGTIEESFISKLNPGNVFWFAGKNLEFVRLKDLTVFVKNAQKKKGIIPRWYGGRMPLSSQLSDMIRRKLEEAKGVTHDVELVKLQPLFDIQQRWSVIPSKNELLIEKIKSREGYHLFVYPFEGRYVHEILAALIAYRLSQIQPASYSIAMNDYGFELLSDAEIPVEEGLQRNIFLKGDLFGDIRKSVNQGEMAKRRFRDIASIAGLIFQGYPGKQIRQKHLQASSQLFFDVFQKYDPENLLLWQAFEEVMNLQIEQSRLAEAMERMSGQEIILKYPPRPTPFAFPIMTERFRSSYSNEDIESRIEKMQLQLEKYAEKN